MCSLDRMKMRMIVNKMLVMLPMLVAVEFSNEQDFSEYSNSERVPCDRLNRNRDWVAVQVVRKGQRHLTVSVVILAQKAL